MDGNTSNNEELEFVSALSQQMPEVFGNIETARDSLNEIDELVMDVKKTLDVEKMNILTDKVAVVSENIDEFEQLEQKLEREILEWNAQKKLTRRDEEFEKITIFCSE